MPTSGTTWRVTACHRDTPKHVECPAPQGCDLCHRPPWCEFQHGTRVPLCCVPRTLTGLQPSPQWDTGVSRDPRPQICESVLGSKGSSVRKYEQNHEETRLQETPGEGR